MMISMFIKIQYNLPDLKERDQKLVVNLFMQLFVIFLNIKCPNIQVTANHGKTHIQTKNLRWTECPNGEYKLEP